MTFLRANSSGTPKGSHQKSGKPSRRQPQDLSLINQLTFYTQHVPVKNALSCAAEVEVLPTVDFLVTADAQKGDEIFKGS